MKVLAQGVPGMEREVGCEDFFYPGSHRLLAQLPEKPDLIHAHNLHGGYFDLRYLAHLSQRIPTMVTLHDQWLLTGHCAYSLGCTRWKVGCGRCPDLSLYPSLNRDGTAQNWRRKQAIYRRSKLYVATPSQWLMDCVQQSMLNPVESRVIPNGVDQAIFHPGDKVAARRRLNLPENAAILLSLAAGGRNNPYKDYGTILQAFASLPRVDHLKYPLVLLQVGGDEQRMEDLGDRMIYHWPYQKEAQQLALIYSASDLFLHAARADTFPTTILEAFSCGIPVVATAVGGIPEQVKDGHNGFLVSPGNVQEMSKKIDQLLTVSDLMLQMGQFALRDARERFDLRQQVKEYLSWYQEIIAQRQASQAIGRRM